MSEIIWKPAPGFPDYEVSNIGGVRRVVANANAKCKELRPQMMNIGYLKAMLYRDKKVTQVSVHRLVLEAFVGPPPQGFVCNHKDGDKTNNRIENLEWVSRGDNTRHSVYVLGNRRKGKLSIKQVKEIRRLCTTSKMSYTEIAKMYAISPSAVSLIMSRKIYHYVK